MINLWYKPKATKVVEEWQKASGIVLEDAAKADLVMQIVKMTNEAAEDMASRIHWGSGWD